MISQGNLQIRWHHLFWQILEIRQEKTPTYEKKNSFKDRSSWFNIEVFFWGCLIRVLFDTVDHEILLSKMNDYGIRVISYEWFKSYLIKRKQFTTGANKQSELATIELGLPQDSILGPLLFLICINSLGKELIFSSVHYFADDTNIFYVHSSLKN